MPCFRGIEISIITDSDTGQLPEFPHPDGSSVRLLGPTGLSPSSHASAASTSSDSNLAHLPKTNPVISVYIPSLPGVQFWIRYSIPRPPESTNHIYFKMFLNGRNITNWGVRANHPTPGSVVRALYEPGETWHYRENGVVLKRDGIESRYFHFSSPESKSVAEDGGLIEVQAFRALGRRSRAARLEQYRSQEKYGIASPSGGLLENPEDMEYYDWLLRDPTDSPYARFRFHYRSWSNLKSLHLVPQFDARRRDNVNKCALLETSKQSEDSTQFEFDIKPIEGVDGQADDNKHIESTEPESRCARKSSIRIQRLEIPSERLRTPTWDRKSFQPNQTDLLDQVPAPKRSLSTSSNLACVSRKTSSESHTFSIAPSLLQYVEDDEFHNEEFEFGVATPVALPHDLSYQTLSLSRPLPHLPDPGSPSDYGSSPPSSDTSASPLMRQSAYTPTTGTALECQLSLYSSPAAQPRSTDGHNIDSTVPKISTLKLTESQWMMRGLSLQRNDAHAGQNDNCCGAPGACHSIHSATNPSPHRESWTLSRALRTITVPLADTLHGENRNNLEWV